MTSCAMRSIGWSVNARPAAVPDRDHDLPLVVRVDQADEVAEHDAVLVAEARARQDQRGEARIGEVDRDAGRDQLAVAGLAASAAASMQARRSSPAAPARARSAAASRGSSASRILTSSFRKSARLLRASQHAGDVRDQLARQLDLRARGRASARRASSNSVSALSSRAERLLREVGGEQRHALLQCASPARTPPGSRSRRRSRRRTARSSAPPPRRGCPGSPRARASARGRSLFLSFWSERFSTWSVGHRGDADEDVAALARAISPPRTSRAPCARHALYAGRRRAARPARSPA